MGLTVTPIAVTDLAGGTVLYDRSGDEAMSAEDYATVMVANLGPQTIYVFPGVPTTANGFPIPTGQDRTFRVWEGQLKAIAATAAQTSPADTRVCVQEA